MRPRYNCVKINSVTKDDFSLLFCYSSLEETLRAEKNLPQQSGSPQGFVYKDGDRFIPNHKRFKYLHGPLLKHALIYVSAYFLIDFCL